MPRRGKSKKTVQRSCTQEGAGIINSIKEQARRAKASISTQIGALMKPGEKRNDNFTVSTIPEGNNNGNGGSVQNNNKGTNINNGNDGSIENNNEVTDNSNKVSSDNVPKEGPKADGVNDAFLIIYKISAIVASCTFIIVCLMAFIDLWVYIIREMYQRSHLFVDPNIMNQYTTDFDALEYIHNSTDDEPYTIYISQTILSLTFFIIGFALITLAVHVSIFIIMMVYAKARGFKFESKLDLPIQIIGVIIAALVGGIILSSIYKSQFLKSARPSLQSVKSRMRDVKSYIYTYVTNNTTFLNALKYEDLETISKSLKENALNHKNLNKLMFTLNIFTFFKTQIPESDPNMETMLQMFTFDNIKNQKIDPSTLFYYKKPLYVPNIYPSIQSQLSTVSGYDEQTFMRLLGSTMEELNRRLVKFNELPKGKSSLGKYIVKAGITGFVLLVLLIVILLAVFAPDKLTLLVGYVYKFLFLQRNKNNLQ
jgi:hypothetical protein